MKSHPYHLVNPSAWPILSSFAALFTCFGAVLFMHDYHIGKILLPSSFALILLFMFLWWKDVVKEAQKARQLSRWSASGSKTPS